MNVGLILICGNCTLNMMAQNLFNRQCDGLILVFLIAFTDGEGGDGLSDSM